MAILGGFLPGLREVRAPLAAGYLWLATIAMIFISRLPFRPAVGSLFEKVYGFASWLGPTALIAAMSFAAYLIGILSVALTGFGLSWAAQNQQRRPELQAVLGGRVTTLSYRGLASLQSLVEEKIAAQLSDANNQQYVKASNAYPGARALLAALNSGLELTERRKMVADAVETDPHVRAILDDLPLVPNRLLGKEPEKFSVFDRQVSEGEFRAALSLPLLGLGLATSVQVGQYWIGAVGAVVSALLFMQARTRTIMAYDQLADFMRSGSITSAVVAELDQATIRLKRTNLSVQEIHAFKTRAEAAEGAGQLDAAAAWYRVPAAAGDVESAEKVCDLTRVSKAIYRDSNVILEPLLMEGSEFSGRLALEALNLLLDRLAHPPVGLGSPEYEEFESNLRWAIWLTALRALKHESSREWAEGFLRASYGGSGDYAAIDKQLELIETGTMEPVAFLSQHPPSIDLSVDELTALSPGLRTLAADLQNN